MKRIVVLSLTGSNWSFTVMLAASILLVQRLNLDYSVIIPKRLNNYLILWWIIRIVEVMHVISKLVVIFKSQYFKLAFCCCCCWWWCFFLFIYIYIYIYIYILSCNCIILYNIIGIYPEVILLCMWINGWSLVDVSFWFMSVSNIGGQAR
jgi:hypothetical protein